MLRCKEAVELMGSASGSPLPLRKRMSLAVHLAWCRHCRKYRRGLDRLTTLARASARTADLDHETAERIAHSVRRAAERASRQTGTAGDS